ncbi:hypothetical protein BY458DRAFT_486162 [Sporodiniella umbellata]|nr:hypothetical protein BY458DRAFT_486162 [Sporodiniella umbellata]
MSASNLFTTSTEDLPDSPRRNNQPKQRPSYRKSSERHFLAAGPSKPLAVHRTQQSQKRRSRSVCASADSQRTDYRRPSAPVMSSTPRLSIASRFMASTPSYFDTDQTIEASSSIDITSLKTLSVADRFMSKEPSISSSTSNFQQSVKESVLSSNSGKYQESCPTTPLGDSVSGRLTIAETFMKSSGTLPLNKRTSISSSKSPSVVSEYVGSSFDLFSAHPLEENAVQNPFDELNSFNIDSCFDSSLDYTLEKVKRPWGSQDTLVQMEQKKKSLYAQLSDSNMDFSDARSLSSREIAELGDYNQSTDCLYKEQNINYEDIEIGLNSIEVKVKESMDKQVPRRPKNQQPEDTESVSGVWLGCCFVSCGQRSDLETLKQEKTLKNKKRGGCGRKMWVVSVFLILITGAIVFGYIWPRTPLMRIDSAALTTPPKISETKQSALVGNVAFESDWLVNITVDNRQNHVPTRLSLIQVVAKNALTGLMLGKGSRDESSSLGAVVIPPNEISTIQIPIHVDYQARDSTDTTFIDLLKACSPGHHLSSNDYTIGQNKALPLHFWITLHFFGLDWIKYNPTVIATPATGGFVCPQ